MITDLTISAIKDYLGTLGAPASTATVFERDTSDDLTYPAIVITEDGDPEEHEIRRGHWRLAVIVSLRTIPEDTSMAVHQSLTTQLQSALADSEAMITAIGQQLECNDCWGGEATTEPNENYRQSDFALELMVAMLG